MRKADDHQLRFWYGFFWSSEEVPEEKTGSRSAFLTVGKAFPGEKLTCEPLAVVVLNLDDWLIIQPVQALERDVAELLTTRRDEEMGTVTVKSS